MKILITGGNGYIAKALFKVLSFKYDVTTITRNDLDLLNTRAVDSWFSDKHFDLVINTASKGGNRLHNDGVDVIGHNLSIFFNLLRNSNNCSRLINIGSGAEICYEGRFPCEPYGLSKYIMRDYINKLSGLFNLRVYGLFDENELDSRFIKANMLRYIRGENMIIHQDKLMDFFYMKDFIEVVIGLIECDFATNNTIDCCYPETQSLLQISNLINKLGNREVGIIIQESGRANSYIATDRSCPFIKYGLQAGLKEVYNKLT